MGTVMYFGILLVAMFVLPAHQQTPKPLTTDQFKALINKSRQDCWRNPQLKQVEKRYDLGQCGRDTIQAMYEKIPGNKATVNLYAPYDLERTLELCVSRENKDSTDWNVITANRRRLGAAQTTSVWTDCNNQMTAEKLDCKNAKNILCGFARGTALECMEDAQKKRTCTTIEQGDKCNAIESLTDGRPENTTEFNQRIAASRRQCSASKTKQPTDQANQFVNANCYADQKLPLLMTRFPSGMTSNAVLAPAGYYQPGLRETVAMCNSRDEVGFPKILARSWQAAYASDRQACQAQLTQEQKDCKAAQQIICAYSYGVDYSCWKQDLKARSGGQQRDACERIVNDVLTNPAG